MALRPLLTVAERCQILTVPREAEEWAAHYTLTDAEMLLIRQRRGDTNRLGFAVQLCLLRFPGIVLAPDTDVPPELIAWLARRLTVSAEVWTDYGAREQTRQDHAKELRSYLGMTAFGVTDFRRIVETVSQVAEQTDNGLLLVESAVSSLRGSRVVLPGMNVIERACAQGLTKATRNIHETVCERLSVEHRKRLDGGGVKFSV